MIFILINFLTILINFLTDNYSSIVVCTQEEKNIADLISIIIMCIYIFINCYILLNIYKYFNNLFRIGFQLFIFTLFFVTKIILMDIQLLCSLLTTYFECSTLKFK
jgi:hypothetical protein